ncbi:CDP-alcohol phosphatidyltransferase family protein [Rhodanobacter lindaniclasticus]|uniref:CDP-diacylglycerol--glycerol-3-phosphate 3-phosphatidyltransferase n=1 Tax=Rhodanobacter lindaniclasticus TaxID=75310 RepID=A0A4S3KG26_9GAMM|nr:CDP-alcohol phosphatidyltransferase family protein [Rhodanobacter lindaniclasticus]THD07592.1 CDP-diacylglycerol--glycerol-3-phosphate 3-phosphatidyltransferase [Rhodanobacter lindaniclasticus]
MQDANRRPIAVRGSGWAQRSAAMLARSRLTPNQISVLSVLFALAGAWALLALPGAAGALLCALAIGLRLLCNLFDGMVAVEGGKGTATGALYNELPDRLTDSLFLVALGYATALPWLGWLAALLAALTAYIRVLGGALGQAQDFRGPMAKPHRMWLLGVALVLAALLPAWRQPILLATAALIAAGSALTCVTRTRAIGARLKGAGA